MESTDDAINRIISRFNELKSHFEKLEGIIEDIKICKSAYTKSILLSAITKLSENIGLKEKLIDTEQ